MLTFLELRHRPCDGISRREFFKVGGLGLGGLALADLLRLRARGAAEEKSKPKSVILIYLPGGPSHIDMYDLKPNAPVEIRGEFKPIPTNVPGFNICELMPLQAKIADKFSMVRGLQSVDTHSAEMLLRGTLGGPVKRPVFGSLVSRMRGGTSAGGMPHYVALGGENGQDSGDPSYLGSAHKPFGGTGLNNLSLVRGVSTAQLGDRKKLLQSFDSLNRELDSRAGDMAGLDTFHARALEMISSTKVRDAFDVNREPLRVRDKYGKNGQRFLRARRLVEAGVSVVTLSAAGTMYYGGDWDTHAGGDQKAETNFKNLRGKLPEYDRTVHALLTDIYDRGLDQEVAVVIWGEFGRTPKINKNGGRDHWAPAGNVLIAGGGLKMGQVIGDTGPKAERDRSRSTPYTPRNVLATLYQILGIDPATTVPDFTGRPMYLLDDREPISELV